MQNIKDIFLDVFTVSPSDESKDIIEQLSNIVEQVIDTDLDTNVKLLELSERRFQGKVNEKISSEITLSQVELATNIDCLTVVLGNILSLYSKLCKIAPLRHELDQ